MSDRNIFQSLFEEAESSASKFFDVISEVVAGEANSLRDGTEFDEVCLPRDLAAHSGVQTEWWYYTGHLETQSGKEFGFELVFFKRRTDLDKFSVVPLRLIGNPFYFAHFGITNLRKQKFRYDHRKSANGLLDYPASASEIYYHVR